MRFLILILLLAILAWELFITFNSCQVGFQSEARSQASLLKWQNWQAHWPLFLVRFWQKLQQKSTSLFYPLYPELRHQPATHFEHFLLRKFAHMSQFFILTTLFLVFWHSLAIPWYNTLVYSLALTLLASVSDEFIQHFIPKRTASVIDVLVDFSGGLVAAIGYCLVISVTTFW